MTFQSPYLVKLQDLKVWQGNYDSWLENRSREITNPSDFDTIEGLSALDSSRSSVDQSITKHIDWDKKAITPPRPFEQLLEEKLAEDEPVQIQDKPKRPFLKKGAGLERYKLTPKVFKTKTSRSNQKKFGERNINIPNKKPIKTTVDANTEPELSMMPLKMPNVIMKQPKATWARTPKYTHVYDENNKAAEESVPVPEKHTNSNIIGKINEFALKHFLPYNTKKSEVQLNKVNVITNLHEYHPDNSVPESPIYFENTAEKDLRIFEVLEERVEHSSFSSTNSSIIRLLASTPNKVKKAFRRSPIQEEKKVENNDDGSTNVASVEFAKKLEDVNKKSDILHEFLNNLKKLSEEKEIEVWNLENDQLGGEKSKSSDTSYSESEKWMGNTDTGSHSPSSFYTDFENTLKGRTCNRIDVGVNTSVDEKTETEFTDQKCLNCDELRKKLEQVLIQLPELQKENAKLNNYANDMEKKRDQLLEELHERKVKYEEDIIDLKKELDNDRKKFSKEKAIFDLYIKESQNRPTKMKREELSALKKELLGAKELLKLKETKNGATQARLRNQIKMLEKDRAELKTSVENLQKENSKLNASQKMRRPSEVKMLHEINRNLTKLTEETFKKHVTKSDISNYVVNDDNSRRESRQNNDKLYDPEISPKLKRKSSLKKKFSTNNSAINDNSNEYCIDMTTFANLSLEKQYENMFGNLLSTGQQNNSLNDSKKGKTEIVFPDGSKEIKYSNGNSKTISPDSNLVIVQYYNGDIKETNISENTLKYYYAENATWHTQFGDGTELLEYPNGQKERKYKDGKKEVTCPDGSFFIKLPDGTEEVRYPDGSKMIKNNNEEKILLLPNGQKEIHTKDHKRREYPDGTLKILYPDGTQETRYASGRVRIKDANGVLILDSEV